MTRQFFLGALIFALFTMNYVKVQAQNDTPMKSHFKNPPPSAFPKTYWWWLNGNMDTVRIKEEMRAMKEAGLSGFDIFDIGVRRDTVVKPGPAFLGMESLQAIKVALELAKELGMTAGLSMASSWNAGGSWTTPEHSAKSIYFSVTDKQDGTVKLKFPQIRNEDGTGTAKGIQFAANGRPVYYKEVIVLAIPNRSGEQILDTSQIVNVTSYFDPDTEILNWNTYGDYQIYRYICSNSGEQLKLPSENSKGPIIDHFDADATRAHFEYVIDQLKTILPGGIENSALKSLYLASYEATGFTWTPTLPRVFREINGYEIGKLIPALFDQKIFSSEIIEMFNRDFRRTLSELMINNFYHTARKISNDHGLKINSESGGPGFPLHNVPVEPLKSLGAMDLPRGEFWINHNRLNDEGIDILRVVKEVSSASHIYGRKIVEEEAFTTFQQWQEGPFEMKPSGDRAFCEGMNKVVVHGFSHNPRGYGYPGIVYGAGTHFNDRRVWWKKIRPFNEYLARISYVAQEGDFVADVLYYYGDAIPNYTGHKNGRFMVGPGYDYEVINTDILKQLNVEGQSLVLPTGARFKMLVLQSENEINPEVFRKIRELSAQGAIILSGKPEKVLLRHNLPELRYSLNDIDGLWSETKIEEFNPGQNRGRVFSGLTPAEVLNYLQTPPDFTYSDASFFLLDYIHYQKNNLDFYFIRNTTDEWISRLCSFRQSGKYAEIWNPVNGRIDPVMIGRQHDGYTDIPMSLPPYGATLVVFSSGMAKGAYTAIFPVDQHPPRLEYNNEDLLIWEPGNFKLEVNGEEKNFTSHIKRQILEGSWEVFFPDGWGAPNRVIFPELISWTDSKNEGVQYFSGTATYKKTFQMDINSAVAEKQKIYLDLGDLTNVAQVWLNDKPLGVTWAKPYRFEVTETIKPGDNFLVVEVANTWSNRLKGDAITGERFTQTNMTNTNVAGLNKMRLPWAEVPLIKAGLFGPVTVQTITPASAK